MFSISNELNDAGETVGVIFHDGRKIGTIEGGPQYPDDVRPRYVARGHEVRIVRDERDVIGDTVYSTSIASSRATVDRIEPEPTTTIGDLSIGDTADLVSEAQSFYTATDSYTLPAGTRVTVAREARDGVVSIARAPGGNLSLLAAATEVVVPAPLDVEGH